MAKEYENKESKVNANDVKQWVSYLRGLCGGESVSASLGTSVPSRLDVPRLSVPFRPPRLVSLYITR